MLSSTDRCLYHCNEGTYVKSVPNNDEATSVVPAQIVQTTTPGTPITNFPMLYLTE